MLFSCVAWANYLTSLFLNFFTHKTGTIVPTLPIGRLTINLCWCLTHNVMEVGAISKSETTAQDSLSRLSLKTFSHSIPPPDSLDKEKTSSLGHSTGSSSGGPVWRDGSICSQPSRPLAGDAGCPALPVPCDSCGCHRTPGSKHGKANAVPASSRTQHFPLLLALFAFLFGLPHGVGTSEWHPTATSGLPKVLSHCRARSPPLLSSHWQAEGSRAWLAHAKSSHTKCHCMGLVCGRQMKGISKSTASYFYPWKGWNAFIFHLGTQTLRGHCDAECFHLLWYSRS